MIKFYDFLLTIFTPIIAWWGSLHFPFTHKKVTGRHYYIWRNDINIGTVLLTTTYGELSNWINPAKIKHAGIYLGDVYGDGVRYVGEALGRGVVLTDLVTFLTTKDLVIGCEPNFIREKYLFQELVTKEGTEMVGTPYDFLFKKDGKSLYCFEYCAAVLKSIYPELRLKCREIVKGKRIYDHNTFLDKDFFTVVFDSRKEI